MASRFLTVFRRSCVSLGTNKKVQYLGVFRRYLCGVGCIRFLRINPHRFGIVKHHGHINNNKYRLRMMMMSTTNTAKKKGGNKILKIFMNISLMTSLLFVYILYNIHYSSPFAPISRMFFNIKSEIKLKSETIVSDKENYDFSLIEESINLFIKNGEDISTQICIYKDDKEIFNYYATNENYDKYNLYKNVDDTTLFPIWSTSKIFTTFAICKAVDMKWINSYNDLMTDYWPTFCDNGNNIKISDVMVHECGIPWLDNKDNKDNKISLINTSYADIKEMIESQKPFCFGDRRYHAFTRGFILNELFHSIEPNGRYMNKYYFDEIFNKLSKNDKKFIFTFNGTNLCKNYDKNKIIKLDVITPNILWNLYHFIVPCMIFKKDKSFNTNNIGQNVCANNKELIYPQYKLHFNPLQNNYFDNFIKKPERKGLNLPTEFSEYFKKDNGMNMEMMSVSGYSNAHSIAKTVNYIINHLISHKTFIHSISNVITKRDKILNVDMSLTNAGFGQFIFNPDLNQKWYGWSGFGGSFLLFNPTKNCVVAYTITGFNRPGYIFPEPRSTLIMHLINKQINKS